MDPYVVMDDLLRFLDLPPANSIDKYIQSHTGAIRSEKDTGAERKKGKKPVLGRVNKNPHGLYRNSKVRHNFTHIQACSRALPIVLYYSILY